ncbi:SGNH/GDSL hydrolase family protein [Actinomycetospora atypica]|uniref:SGNH/GDSL hydrolase family protein n=1 Tax=Actinomycetospora atypica TaxID=1290095 RepID=A0ABV9YI36_9PSEU
MSSRSSSRRLRRALQRLDAGSDRARTLPVIALAVLAVVVVTAALATQPSASSSGPTRAETVASVDAGPLPAAVIGDSISAGTAQGGLGAANWTKLLGAQRQWDVVNTSIGGTGYLNPGTAAPFQAAQLDKVVTSQPKIVIVEGSPNDITLPVGQVSAAADRLYRDLAARLPGVRIIAVGPFWNGTTRDDAMEWVDALADTAAKAGVTWIDPMREGWFTGAYDQGRGLIGPDRVHPTDAGHALYARRLNADLDRLGV